MEKNPNNFKNKTNLTKNVGAWNQTWYLMDIKQG